MFKRTLYIAILAALAAGADRLTVVRAQPPGPGFSIDDTLIPEGSSRHTIFFLVRLGTALPTESRVRFRTVAGTADVHELTHGSNPATVTIPGSGTGLILGAPASLYPILINVPTNSPVRNLSAGLVALHHTRPSDLDVLLVAPNGEKVVLLSDVGGDNDAVNVHITFSQLAQAAVGASLTSGRFLPSDFGGTGFRNGFPTPAPPGPYGSSLAVFDNYNPFGVWHMYVVDDAPNDTGTVNQASVGFEMADSDFYSAAGEVVFPPGVTSRLAFVVVQGDSTQEPNERFVVELFNPVNATISDGLGIFHILNDDGGGTPPATAPDAFATPVNTPLSVAAPGVLGNDTNTEIGGSGGSTMTAVLVTPPASGAVVLNPDGSFVYVPRPGHFGPDSFRYQALNTFALSSLTTVSLTIGSLPASLPDAFSTPFNTTLGVAAPGVLANDDARLSGLMFAQRVSGPAHGSLTLNNNGSFVYAPANGYHGPDSFAYRAGNTLGFGLPTTVTLTVGPPPTAVADAFAAAFETPLSVAAPGVLGNDDSHGGGALTATLLSTTVHGTLSLQGSGGFTYIPQAGFAGTDTFTYRADAAAGTGGSATVTVTVNEPTTIQAPTDLYVSAMAGNTVTFRFAPPALGPDATGYVLEGGLNPGEAIASIATGSDAPIFTIAAPAGSFFVRMHALRGAEKSGPSNEIRVHVSVPVPPSAPDRFSSAVSGNRLALSWRNTFAGGPPAGLVLEVSGGATAQLPLGGNAESLVVAGAPGGTFTLSLRAQNGGGSSAATAPITVTIPGACPGPPEPPAAFLAYRLGSTAFVVWEPAATGPAAESFVLNVTGSFVGSIPIATRSVSSPVAPGSYTVSVAAVNPCGTSTPTVAQTIVVP